MQRYDYMPGYHHPDGWELLVGPLLWLIFLTAVVVLVLRWLKTRDDANRATGTSPLDIVRMRYAKGEINKEEYERLLKDLK